MLQEGTQRSYPELLWENRATPEAHLRVGVTAYATLRKSSTPVARDLLSSRSASCLHGSECGCGTKDLHPRNCRSLSPDLTCKQHRYHRKSVKRHSTSRSLEWFGVASRKSTSIKGSPCTRVRFFSVCSMRWYVMRPFWSPKC